METNRRVKLPMRRRMGLWVAALIFLCNPNIHAMDPLPDFIGYLLIVSSLRRVSAIDESFADASRGFRRMAWLSVARLLGLIWVFGATSATEQPVLLLIIAFVLGVLELMTVIPACHQLFHGLSYLSMRMDSHVVSERANAARLEALTARLQRAEREGKSAAYRARLEQKIRRMSCAHAWDVTERACFLTQGFACVKTVLCVLPELTALADSSYAAGNIMFNWYAYIAGLRALAVLVGMVVGIAWLCSILSYCRRLAKDRALWDRLATRCDEDEATHPERVPARRLRRALFALTIACVFNMNFYMDGFNYLPDIITPVALIAALLALRSYLSAGWRLLCTLAVALQSVAATVLTVSSTSFFATHYVTDIRNVPGVAEAYTRLVFLPAFVNAGATVLSLIAFGAAIGCLIDRYTVTQGTALSQTPQEVLMARRCQKLKRHLIVPLILGLLSVVAHVVYYIYLPSVEQMWLIDFAMAAVFAVFAGVRLYRVREMLDEHRMVVKDSKNTIGIIV